MEKKWPALSYEKGKLTFETIHLWTQVVGKIKMTLHPWINHSWHVALHITPTGLTTQNIPCSSKNFQIDFDFTSHQLKISTSDGEDRRIELPGLSVATFYTKTMDVLKELGIKVSIRTIPSEIENPIPFEEDFVHATYDKEQVATFHQALLLMHDVFMQFRSEFKCKSSPINFFWGSFDVAFSLFSGRDAPKHPGGIVGLPDWVAEEAYSKEVASCGFWPGNAAFPEPIFYSYIYPEPKGYKTTTIESKNAYYHPQLREFVLPYSMVQQDERPKYRLLQFLHTAFRAGTSLAKWDKDAL
jgi:hypothetical protein